MTGVQRHLLKCWTYYIKDVTAEVHSCGNWRRNLLFHKIKSARDYTVNINWLTSNSAPGMTQLKFIYLPHIYPGTDPRQQVVKKGPGEPEVVLDAAVI